MNNIQFFRTEYDRIASSNGGVLGDPRGIPAYAYLRVSTDEQAEDGSYGIPRQMEHVHEKALEEGYSIPWGLVFSDDYTGFEFEGRPGLTALRREYKRHNRRASVVFIEHLDRLSRNADWHQGFLLDEMDKHGIRVFFWKSFNSRIEQAVMGAISQDAMRDMLQRMKDGNLRKARSGRVTSRMAPYGYRIVDSNGQESAAARKDTHYGIYEPEAVLIREMYSKLAQGVPMRAIAREFTERGIKPPKAPKFWDQGSMNSMIKNPVYKGEFYANRWERRYTMRQQDDGTYKRVLRHVLKPEAEWILVPVPAIVSPALWEEANRMLQINQQTAKRKARRNYLLSGLLKCACCGLAMRGTTKRIRQNGRRYYYGFYRCLTRSMTAEKRLEQYKCTMREIRADLLDANVWRVIEQALTQPELILQSVEHSMQSEANQAVRDQIDYLERELASFDEKDAKLERAYFADVFDEQEYAARRKALKEENQRLKDELARLRPQLLTPEHLEAFREQLLRTAATFRENGLALDPPFDLKKQIIKRVVDRVTVNADDGWFRLDGFVRGAWDIDSGANADAFVFGSALALTGHNSRNLCN